MIKFTIEVNEDDISRSIVEKITDNMVKQYGNYASELRIGIRGGVEKAVKAHIYDKKDEIIEKCIARASAELVRKGIPKLLEIAGKEAI